MLSTPRFANIATRFVAIVTLAFLFTAAGGPLTVLHAASLAATAPGLGTAASFAVLGGSAVTNTGPSIITRDLGVWPGSSVTGFPPGIVTGGVIHATDAVALQAKSDLTTAYNNLAGQSCTTDLTGKDLGGKTLTTGVYCFSSSAQLTGKLTLDAQGNPNAVFIFKIGSTLTTASTASVSMINAGGACNVYWQVGSSATLGTGTTFSGNILALASISVTTGTSITGRALARVGAVTLDTNHISAAGCVAASAATATATASATAPATATTRATATPTATATHIPGPTATALPPERDATNTPVPAPSSTPVATALPTEQNATNTPVPAPSNAPALTVAPSSSPAPFGTPLAVLHLPDTGGAPRSGGDSSWSLMLSGLIATGGGLSVLGLKVRAQRRACRAEQE